MYVQAVSMDDLDAKLKIATKEAMEFGCTWSISKFLLVRGFQVVLDSYGWNPPQIGPDPSRVKQFSEIQPPTTTKTVRTFLGFVT